MESHRSLFQLLSDWAAAVAATSNPRPPAYDGPDVPLSGFVEHSDQAAPGTCFVARLRTGSDGHGYIGAAVARGTSLVLGQWPRAGLAGTLGQTPYLQADDTAVALAWLAAAWHGFPGRRLVMIGVTGTDGKTTTSTLLFQVLRAAALRAGMVSTVYAALGDANEPLEFHVTTPEAPVLQRLLRRMVDSGLTHCVLETTSHGLAQHRVDAIGFDVAVVTNVTHEHLDYHGDYAGYLAAKARLLAMVAEASWAGEAVLPLKAAVTRTAVLNRDDRSFEPLSRIAVPRQIAYGLSGAAGVTADNVTYGADATRLTLRLPGSGGQPSPRLPVTSPLVGEFNVYNMLAAAAAGHALGVAPEAIASGLVAVAGVSGRMERLDRGQPFKVVVDFAHTPNALEKAIAAARRMAAGRVIAVFGSAGKRDVAKRRLMAEIGAQQADLVVLTAEDPRTESLEAILAMMAEGCRRKGGVEGETFWRVPDRGRAIYHALTLARPEDVVLICGKGHEQSMCFITTEYPWDDREATRAALEAFLAGGPAPDLGLPTFAP